MYCKSHIIKFHCKVFDLNLYSELISFFVAYSIHKSLHRSNLMYLLIKRQLLINQTSMTHTKMCTVKRQTTKIRTIDLSF